MLRKQEKDNEISNIKGQIKDLREEVNKLKLEIRVSRIYGENSFSKGFQKFSLPIKSDNYNQQLLKQFSKLIPKSFNVPSSFGKII